MPISYRASLERSWMQAAPSVATVRALAGTLDNPDPVSLRELLEDLSELESITREMDINTDDDTPLNGHVGFTLRSDGTYEFFGHMRATGFPSYHYGVQAWIETGDASGTVIGGQRSGH